MATPGFLPSPHILRSLPSPYQPNRSASHYFDREACNPIGTPFSTSPPAMANVLIRRLPLHTTEESLRLMLVWSQELAEIELLPPEKSEDDGFLSALLSFRSMNGAIEVKAMLDGRPISNDADLIVKIVGGSPASTRRHTSEAIPHGPHGINNTSSPPSAPGSRQPSRLHSLFPPIDGMPQTVQVHNAIPGFDYFGGRDSSAAFHGTFAPQSPIGGHLSSSRISGKTLISSDPADDDETTDLLNNPVAYAESGANNPQRRATAPQLPIVSRMAGMSLGNGQLPSPASASHYMGPLSPGSVSGHAPIGHSPVPQNNNNGNYQSRHVNPPANPADQNPPCNTLYVGNLPLDTSEEELKATFSKQRGYKRLCFRTKANGPMCFVEFEDVSFATKALTELYGHMLHNSVRGGIRLSFSKNPLGVRSGQAPGHGSVGPSNGPDGIMSGNPSRFIAVNGPPPGLAAPPGLGAARGGLGNQAPGSGVNGSARMNGAAHQPPSSASTSDFTTWAHHPWNFPPSFNGRGSGAPNGSTHFPRHMMGK